MDDPPLDRQTVDVIIRLLMRFDARLEAWLAEEDDDGEEEEDT